MRTRKKRERLFFEKLLEICAELNKQIPLIANRFHQFECVPVNPDWDDEKRQAVITKFDEDYAVFDQKFEAIKFQHYFYKELIILFKDYEREHPDITLKEYLLLQAENIYRKLQRRQKYLPEVNVPKLTEIERILQGNIDYVVEALKKGSLQIEDAEMQKRMEIFDELASVRKHMDEQTLINFETLLMGFKEDKITEFKKIRVIEQGLFLERGKYSVGFCEEFKCLSLLKILRLDGLPLYKYVDYQIEEIAITYLDDDNRENDGHTFLAINRDPNSKLEDISTWGEKAILFDAWNNLVVYASEFSKLPIYYCSYPEGAIWNVHAKFSIIQDRTLIKSLSGFQENYFVTGNYEMEKRIPLLMEEYQLISLKQPGFEQTRRLMEALVRDMRQTDFKYEVEVFLTTGCDELINVISGFNEPKIAIRMEAFSCSMEELQFGIARALACIQNHWSTNIKYIASKAQFEINKAALLVAKNGPAAIKYLRHSEEFRVSKCKEYDRFSRWKNTIRLSAINRDEYYYSNGMPSEQIKSLMTLLALAENAYLHEGKKEEDFHSIPDLIKSEIQEVKNPEMFFHEKFHRLTKRKNKINFLIQCLPDLQIELVPYEKEHTASIRVKHFCLLLSSLKLDMEKSEDIKAAERLINRAFELRIPAFNEIYFAAHDHCYDIGSSGYYGLKPLGPFKPLQDAISEFVNARTVAEAIQAAQTIHKLKELLKDHLNDNPFHLNHLLIEQYLKEYDCLPTGKHRFFGSKIGKFMKWKAFEVEKNKPKPWTRHIGFIGQDSSGLIAQTLLMLGVRHDPKFWATYKVMDLLKMMQSSDFNYPFINVEGEEGSYYWALNGHRSEFESSIHRFMADKCKPKTSMLRKKISFEEKLIRFYDLNLPILIYPQGRAASPHINEAVKCLLNLFQQAMESGSSQEKQIVYDFFFSGLVEKRSLKQLMEFDNKPFGVHLKGSSHYVQFMLKYFTGSQIRELQDRKAHSKHRLSISLTELPLEEQLKLYEIPLQNLSIELLEKYLPIINKESIISSILLINAYFQQPSPAYSLAAFKIIRLIKEGVNSYYFYGKPQYFNWDNLSNPDLLSQLTIKEIIFLYRTYESQLAFPSFESRQQAGEIILQKIDQLESPKDQLIYLELLLLQTEFSQPIMHMKLRDEVIRRWVAIILQLYGKDDQSVKYKEQLTKIIDRILEKAATRDVIFILEKLAVIIESQFEITDYLGEHLETEKYLVLKGETKNSGISHLASISQLCGQSESTKRAFLNFISLPISIQTLKEFAGHLSQTYDIQYLNDHYRLDIKDELSLCMLLQNVYHVFWGRKLEERAVIIDHVLIPATKVSDEETMKKAYVSGYKYIVRKLLPDAYDPDSEDHVVNAMLHAYLETADQYVRSILLAGLLVATNESYQQKISVGKKLAMLCEHMGPAYIKLAQAVHSHPKTPDNIRRDLDHVKGRANPPYRWQLFRVMQEAMTSQELKRIKRVGQLLGSASYNLALEILQTDGSDVVLLLLREHARRDAERGFKHLNATLCLIDHVKINPSKESISSIIEEAKNASEIEMDKVRSEIQYGLAQKIYAGRMQRFKFRDNDYQIQLLPVKFITNGYGFRIIERVYGPEFNHLPKETEEDKRLREIVAETVVTVELTNILRCGHFDSDRHGNQMRVMVDHSKKIITLGLYDFGEMSLEPPQAIEIERLALLLTEVSKQLNTGVTLGLLVESLIAKQIEEARKKQEPTAFLMRIRKSMLALHDFLNELSLEQQKGIFKKMLVDNTLHPSVKKVLMKGAAQYLQDLIESGISSFLSFFKTDKETDKKSSHNALKK